VKERYEKAVPHEGHFKTKVTCLTYAEDDDILGNFTIRDHSRETNNWFQIFDELHKSTAEIAGNKCHHQKLVTFCEIVES